MPFADIHIHVLFGVDDGAKTEAEMYAIVDASYVDGVRALCVTPHFHPGLFENNIGKTESAYQLLSRYVQEHYPDMNLYPGNELRYSQDCISWLADGLCSTLNNTRFVLIDFHKSVESKSIVHGMEKLLNAGYIPVLAHAERYHNLGLRELRTLRVDGVVVQIDAQSVFGTFGVGTQLRCKRMIAERMVDIVASDAHNLKNRTPFLSTCYSYIAKRFGTEYANAVCEGNAMRILHDNTIGKD